MKIIFMGTPQFACPTLQILLDDSEIEVLAVYTKEPKIAGRGHKITNSPIHELALKNNLKVITPKTLKTPEAQQEFIDLNADAAVVVAYGLILPKEVLEGTNLGCVNIHPSLLPRWRGAAPLQRTLMAGDKETGICIIKMDQGVDSGDIISQEKFDLEEEVRYQELAQRCSEEGATLLLKTIKKMEGGDYSLIKQDDSKAVHAQKIDKKEALIDWSRSAQEINNKIRGLSGNIGAYFEHEGERIKVLKARVTEEKGEEGELEAEGDEVKVYCGDGAVYPLVLQRAGKEALEVKEFLKGFRA